MPSPSPFPLSEAAAPGITLAPASGFRSPPAANNGGMPSPRLSPNLEAVAPSVALHAMPQGDASGAPPEWVHLLPSSPFSGRDGRGPYAYDPAAIVAAFAAWGGDLSIDYEHQGIHAARNGQPAPAAAWIKGLEARDSGIWGRVDWTERGAAMVCAREYRYLSPVFEYDPKTLAVLRLTTAGLVSNPNLTLTAINARLTAQESPMDDIKERVCYLLNLPVTSTPEEITAHLQRLIDQIKAPAEAMSLALAIPASDLPGLLAAAHARLGAAPDPAQYVAVAAHQLVVDELAALKAAAEEVRVETAVNGLLEAGKLLPLQVEWARDYARRDAAGFQAFADKAPVVAPPTEEVATHARAAAVAVRDPAFRAPAGAVVDADSLALHSRALAWQAEHKTDYLTAVNAVSVS